MPQLPPEQVAEPLAGTGQRFMQAPQLLTSLPRLSHSALLLQKE